MDTKTGLNRETKFALMSAVAAGLISIILVGIFIEILTWLFIPCVMLMVFISAYFAFRRRVSGKGRLDRKRIFQVAFEVGTLTHFYTFALYLPVVFLFDGGGGRINLDIFGTWISITLLMGLVSLVMFVWIAVPLYMGVGYIQKSMENEIDVESKILDDSLLDDVLLTPDVDTTK